MSMQPAPEVPKPMYERKQKSPLAVGKEIRQFLNAIPEGRGLVSGDVFYLRRLADQLPTKQRLPRSQSDNRLQAISALVANFDNRAYPHDTRNEHMEKLLVAIRLILTGATFDRDADGARNRIDKEVFDGEEEE